MPPFVLQCFGIIMKLRELYRGKVLLYFKVGDNVAVLFGGDRSKEDYIQYLYTD